ncbi:MAG: hypothetical protein E7054_07175 [Lentisphaerae bacterium]|nr:hypothetical protein [Lentisphaerota bacterium]
MFKIECDQMDIPCTIVDAYVAECKFPPKPGETNTRGEMVVCYYDLVLQLQDANGNTDVWHGEISNRCGTGTNAHLYRLDLTLKTLQKIDFNVQTLTELEQQFVATPERTIAVPNLREKTCIATVVRTTRDDGRVFCNVKYIGSGPTVKKMSYDDFLKRKNAVPSAPAVPAVPAPGYPAAPGAPAVPPAPGYPAAPAAPAPAAPPANPYSR